MEFVGEGDGDSGTRVVPLGRHHHLGGVLWEPVGEVEDGAVEGVDRTDQRSLRVEDA